MEEKTDTQIPDQLQSEVKPGQSTLDQMAEGYRIYREWAEAMAAAGNPLPPGGTMLVNRQSIFVAHLFDLRRDLAAAANVDHDLVEIDLQAIDGRIAPKISFRIPEMADQTAQAMVEQHFRAIMSAGLDRFTKIIDESMRVLGLSVRPDLEQHDGGTEE